MKAAILILAYAALAASTAIRDKRSWSHASAYPISSYTVVRPSNTVPLNAINLVCLNALCTLLALRPLPVYEYPESTEIHTHANTVYSVSVPITHTVHLEQPEHSHQVYYHNTPQISSYQPTYSYNTVDTPVYTPQVYTPQYYNSYYTSPIVQNPWPYARYASTWC